MRKLFCAAAAFVLTLTLAACSGEAREVPVERVDQVFAEVFADPVIREEREEKIAAFAPVKRENADAALRQ